jgi:hypothetical protein
MADGRALSNGEKFSDNCQKLFIVDGRAIFVNGIAGMNMEVVRVLQKNNNASASFISTVCRDVLDKHKNEYVVKKWIEEYETGTLTDESAIPICITAYEYKPDGTCYFDVFSMENNFESNPRKLKEGATLYRGVRMEEARDILRTKNPIVGDVGFINKTLETFNKLDNTYIEVGGDIIVVTINEQGITLKTYRKNEYHTASEKKVMNQLYLIGASGNVVLDENGILQTDTIQLADNVDSSHPLKFKFYIDENTIRYDKIKLNFSLERFRAYSRSVSYGGGGSTTSASGGGDWTTAQSMTINLTTTQPENITGDTRTEGYYFGSGGHNHGIGERTRLATWPTSAGGWVEWVSSGNHSHPIVLPSHSHSIIMPPHSHSVSLPSHSHQVNIPSHTHDIDYGIYESTYASGVQIRIDGVIRNSTTYYGDSNVDITQWINTPGWHTIELTSSQLGRINAALYMRTFVGS